MPLPHQKTNLHRKLVTQTPTEIMHWVIILIQIYDNKSSSFDEINVSTLNEPQNRDLTTEERKQEAEEQKNKKNGK